MFLHSLEVKNYRSLEHVELSGLGNFNVLIGRNNSGKSAVFGALLLLNDAINGKTIDWEPILTLRDSSRDLELRLVFDLRPHDREKFIGLVSTELEEARHINLSKSPFSRQVEYLFKSEAAINRQLELLTLRLIGEDGRWATIMNNDIRTANKAVNISAAAKSSKRLEHHVLSVGQATHYIPTKFKPNFVAQLAQEPSEPLHWLVWRVGTYLNQAFFFNPFRHSEALQISQQTEILAQNGSNLAQVLHTINSNNRPLFSKIERFLQAALPDVGVLQTPLIGNNTEVSFRSPNGDYPVRLHDMGGGIEQLLMVATVLLTTNEESTVFLEEPESHLHAGAQRFLNEKLYEESRQVFISTHSPTFINFPRNRKMYQIKKSNGRTAITHLSNTDLLSEVLEDVGSRNSDVLLSDAVLFVEGPGDQRVFAILSEKLGISLEEHNVTIVPMGGGEGAARGARARSDVLEGVSQKAPVPHLFVLDRDERSKAEIDKLQSTLEHRLHLLQRRELENYLLVPRALLAAIRSKHSDNATIIEKLDAASEKQIENLILTTAVSLYDLILVKRIRNELAGLKGGLLPRDSVASLAHKTGYKNFPRILRKEIDSRLSQHLAELDIDRIIGVTRKSLNKDWSNVTRRSWLAPGEEIVAAIFHHFGSEYRKPNDTIRIACEMNADEIADEIKELIKKAVALTKLTED